MADIKTLLLSAASRLQRAQAKFDGLSEKGRKDVAASLRLELSIRSKLIQYGPPPPQSHPHSRSNESQRTSYGASVFGGVYDGYTHDADPVLAKLQVDAEKALSVARLKAEKLLVDDESSDLMSLLERCCDVLIEGRSLPDSTDRLDEEQLEAICGILATSSRIDSPELLTLNQALAEKYPDLTMETTLRKHISPMLVPHLNPARPTQTRVDTALVEISGKHDLPEWTPPNLLPHDRTYAFLGVIDPSVPVIDIPRLRFLCSHGIPANTPEWVRLSVWSILLSVLPADKTEWHAARAKSRNDYGALVGQIQAALLASPPPVGSNLQSGEGAWEKRLAPQDRVLLQFARDIDAMPPELKTALRELSVESDGKYDVEFEEKNAVVKRLVLLKASKGDLSSSSPPTDVDELPIPSITLDDPPHSGEQRDAKVLLSSHNGELGNGKLYEGFLLRMLYVHSSLHALHALPMGPPPALASIFAVTLLVAWRARQKTAILSGESPSEVFEEVEAETFWLTEALVASVRELVEETIDEGEAWPIRFSGMVRWADAELWTDLNRKGLDPQMPYYSYRWVPTLFTHALSLDALLTMWDAMISLHGSSRHRSPAQSVTSAPSTFVYILGTAMLIRARAAIFQSDSAALASRGATTTHALSAFWKRQTRAAQEIQIPHSPSTYSPIASPKTPASPTMAASATSTHGHSQRAVTASVVSPHVAEWNLRSDGTQPLTPGGMGNVFLVVVRLLVEYDVASFGGTERLLDTAWSLWRRWNREGAPQGLEVAGAPPRLGPTTLREPVSTSARASPSGGMVASLGRIRDMAWKGLTNDMDDDDGSNSPSPGTSPVKKPSFPPPSVKVTSPTSTEGQGAGFLSSLMNSKLTESVWKGMTNQLDSPEPSPDASPVPSPTVPTMQQQHPEIEIVHESPQHKHQRSLDWMSDSGASNSWTGEGAASWARGALSRTSENLRVKALDAWSRKSTATDDKEDTVSMARSHSPSASLDGTPAANGRGESTREGYSASNSSIGSWSEMFSKRGSLPLVGSLMSGTGEPARSGSESGPGPTVDSPNKRESFSPPARPARFRESMIGSVLNNAGLISPETPSTGDSTSKSPLQAALAALTGSPKTEATPKQGPKPLLLNSSSLITPSGSRSGMSSRSTSRRASPSPIPTPRPGDQFSMSMESGDDSVTPGASHVVQLRRGPITNPRTAGYRSSTGATATTRDGSRSSRASTSSIHSPSHQGHRYSIDLNSEDDLQRIEKHGSIDHKSGFVIVRGEVAESPVRVTSMGDFDSSASYSGNEDVPRRFSSASLSSRIKREGHKPAPISTGILPASVPELQVITPRSGDKMDKGEVASSPPRPYSPMEPPDQPDVIHVGDEEVRTPVGAKLTRSRTPIRKGRQGSTGSKSPRSLRRQRSGDARLRDSVIGASGSEEDGARADVEDLEVYDRVY